MEGERFFMCYGPYQTNVFFSQHRDLQIKRLPNDYAWRQEMVVNPEIDDKSFSSLLTSIKKNTIRFLEKVSNYFTITDCIKNHQQNIFLFFTAAFFEASS